jgi:tetratricopeptide (TPR) repeat protein
LPQKWAMTQNNLGNGLRSQGERVSGEESVRLLEQAVDSCLQALTIYTRDDFPRQWAVTENNLARTYWRLRNWREAAEAYVCVLGMYQDNQEAYSRATSAYHDLLFRFQEAFELDRQWVVRHSDDVSARVNFAEKHFTTGRFNDFEQQFKAILAKPGIQPSAKIALQAVEIANSLALGQPRQACARLDSIIEQIGQQPPEFKVEWSFAGTRHFIGQHEKLARYRAWLDELFDAITLNETRDKILRAMSEVRASFKE